MLMASCVQKWAFDEYTLDGDGQVRGMLEAAIFNVKRTYAVMSKVDTRTPFEVDTYDIDAWVHGSRIEAGALQSKKCRDCMDLVTDAFEPKTDALKIEAILLTTGAAAGILWLAFMLG